MTQAADYTIRLIRALLQEQPVPPIPEGVSLGELFDFSKGHSVEALVFRGLATTGSHSADPVWAQWGQRSNQLLAQSIVQLQERDDIIRNLTDAGIDLMPVKGCWLKELYPELSDRQMSDLDMLIHPADAPSAEAVLLGMGFRRDEVCFHHTTYIKPPYTALELHTCLLPDTDAHGAYYESVWDRAVSVEGTPRLYRLTPEDEYLYYLVHLHMHMTEGGSGLRSILDHAIYSRCFPDLNAAYLETELETLGLSEFARQVRALSRCWFETGAPVPGAIEPLARAVCTAGTYGTLETRTHNRMARLRQKHRNPVTRFFAYSLPRFFRPLSEMKRRYPVLEKAPLLLPVFWVVRMVSMMLHNEKSFRQHLGLVFREGGRHG